LIHVYIEVGWEDTSIINTIDNMIPKKPEQQNRCAVNVTIS